MGINIPRPDGFRIISKDFLEFFHINIHQLLPLFRRISGTESDIRMRNPRVLPTPFQAGIFHLRLGNLEPSSHLRLFIQQTFQQMLIFRFNQCVILQEESGRKIVFIHQLQLLLYRLIQQTIRVLHPIVGLTNKINNINDSWRW